MTIADGRYKEVDGGPTPMEFDGAPRELRAVAWSYWQLRQGISVLESTWAVDRTRVSVSTVRMVVIETRMKGAGIELIQVKAV